MSDYSLFTNDYSLFTNDYSLSLLTYRIRQIIPNRPQTDFYNIMDIPIHLATLQLVIDHIVARHYY